MNRKPQHAVELVDGRLVRFSIKARPDEPFYFVVFRGIDGNRLELSTKEVSQKRALEQASKIIRGEYGPRALESPSWEVAIAALRMAMEANNNRRATIDDYQNTLRVLRSFFPASKGPGDITPQLAKQF